ncbi:MAG: DMT family transporter [Pseudobdellovibrionaceae bacterium]
MTPPLAHKEDRPGFAILLSILGGISVTIMNGFAKAASSDFDPIETVFYRGLLALALLSVYILATGQQGRLKTNRPKVHLLRSFVGTVSVCLVYWSYALMPMANATALLMTSGLIITGLSVPLLKEHVGLIRWSAVILGFIGALIITKPTGADFNVTGTIVCFVAAFTIASVALLLRSLGRSEEPLATIYYFMVFSVVASGLYVAIFKDFSVPRAALPVLAGVGIFSLVQQFFKTHAAVLAEASILSPYSYLTLIWAVIIGVIFWGDWPELNVWIGSALIIGANLVVLWREQRKKKKLASTCELS